MKENRGRTSGRCRDLYMVISLKYYRFSRVRTNDLPAEAPPSAGGVSEHKCFGSDPDELDFDQRPLTETLVDDSAQVAADRVAHEIVVAARRGR
jgi:hypothetical protein